MLTHWKNHRNELKSYIGKQVDDQDIIEDILHEVYIKASSNIQQLNEQGNLRSWLYRITRNTIIDYYRLKKDYEELPENIFLEDADPVEENYKILANCIKPLIQELPEKYRTVLELSDLEGMSQKDIANKLGLSLSGTKSRVQRGRQKLHEIMLQCCHFELIKGGVSDFTPRNEKSQKYYDSISKRFL
jgi:RNA polymerase sigma-70 factor (ECF subfamily)